jgi:PEP-CTERM motif
LLSEESVYANQSLASMGLIPAVYVYKWGSGDTADSLTIVVGDVPEPSSWALLLLGFAGLGYIGNRASWKGLAIAA